MPAVSFCKKVIGLTTEEKKILDCSNFSAQIVLEKELANPVDVTA